MGFKRGAKNVAGLGDVGRVQNGRDDADAGSSSSQNLGKGLEIDAADGKPGKLDVGSSPADILERDGRRGGLGRSGKNGTDGDIIRAGAKSSFGLGRGMGA